MVCAHVFARCGYSVILRDIDSRFLDRALETISRNLDREIKRAKLARAEKPLFQPEEQWEKVGQVPNVVFVEGLVREGSRGCSITAALISTSAWQSRSNGERAVSRRLCVLIVVQTPGIT